MNEATSMGPGPLALSVRRRVDAACDRFEVAWRAGPGHRAEEFLGDLPGPERLALLRELIPLEVYYRRQWGQECRPEDYTARFPDLDPAWLATALSPRATALSAGPQLPPSSAADTAVLARPASAALPGAAGGRYRLLEEVGRGGMGVVHKGRDPHLGRELAVKILREHHQDDPEAVRRFLGEARIAGQLQHPGVVPVYELGNFLDGRPFFTMKLVHGRTLAQLLAARPSPGEDLPRLVKVFEQVCQTVAYAHSRGVIHRDLKPANVMVGAFGEVQVMDWGLAKVLGEDPLGPDEPPRPEGECVVETERPPRTGPDTEPGAVLGTYAYMAPEQARGAVGALDERTDVFGLGAILCEVLTGQPPYIAAEDWQVYPKAAAADLAEAWGRLDGCGADAELVALARRCLAAEPGDRPRHAGAVAEAVTAYLTGVQERLRRTELERAAAAARAGEERKRRRMAVALAAAVVGVLLLGGAVWWWVQRQAEERRRGVEAALDKAAQMQGRTQWPEARAVLAQAADRLGDGGPPDLRRRLERQRRELDLTARLEAIRLRLATIVEGRFDYTRADQEYAKAFREAELGVVGEDSRAVAARVRISGARQALVDALDNWAFTLRRGPRLDWVLAVARQADPDPWRDRARDAKVWTSRAALGRLAQQASGRLAEDAPPGHVPSRFVGFLALRLHGLNGDAEALLRAAQRQLPGDFWINLALGNALHAKKQLAEAIGFFRAALAVRPNAAVARYNLGVAFQDQGELGEAVAEYRRAIALEPKFAGTHTNFGIALSKQGKLGAAVAEFRRAIALDPKDAKPHTSLGNALKDQGQLGAAVAEHRRAIALDPKFAMAHTNLGMTLRALGQLGEAMAEYRRAIALDPKQALAHTNLGNALKDQGQLPKAMAEYRRAIAVDPKNALAHYNLGTTLSDQGHRDEAVAEFRRAIVLDPKDAAPHYNLGFNLFAQGKRDEAAAEYRRAIALEPKLAMAHNNLGFALYVQGQLGEAVAEYRRAIALEPNLAGAHYNLGNALYAQGRRREAVAAYRHAIALEPKYAEAHCNLGMALRMLGRLQESLDCFRRGHRLGMRRRDWHQPSADWVKLAEQLAELDTQLPAFLKGTHQPGNGGECLALAEVCRFKQRYAAAAHFFAEAFSRLPQLAADRSAGYRYNAACYAALAGAGRGQDAGRLVSKKKARLRGRALAWLRAELTLWGRQLTGGKPRGRQIAKQRLRHWQIDPDLAGVRDKAALAKLPEAERQEWAKLWADVAALLAQAGPTK
jgi:serine/threonine-protein kinase